MTDQDLLLEEFHQAGIWLPGEGFDQCDSALWSRVQQCVVNAKTIQTNRYKKAMGGSTVSEDFHGIPRHRVGPCEAPWNRHPPSRQCSCSWSASWQGLREALARQFLQCRPAFLWAFIVAVAAFFTFVAVLA